MPTMARRMPTERVKAPGAIAARVGTDPDLGPFLLQEWLDGRTFAEAREDDAIETDLWPRLGHQIALLHFTPPASSHGDTGLPRPPALRPPRRSRADTG